MRSVRHTNETVEPASIRSVQVQAPNGAEGTVVLAAQRLDDVAAMGALGTQGECLIGRRADRVRWVTAECRRVLHERGACWGDGIRVRGLPRWRPQMHVLSSHLRHLAASDVVVETLTDEVKRLTGGGRVHEPWEVVEAVHVELHVTRPSDMERRCVGWVAAAACAPF